MTNIHNQSIEFKKMNVKEKKKKFENLTDGKKIISKKTGLGLCVTKRQKTRHEKIKTNTEGIFVFLFIINRNTLDVETGNEKSKINNSGSG